MYHRPYWGVNARETVSNASTGGVCHSVNYLRFGVIVELLSFQLIGA